MEKHCDLNMSNLLRWSDSCYWKYVYICALQGLVKNCKPSAAERGGWAEERYHPEPLRRGGWVSAVMASGRLEAEFYRSGTACWLGDGVCWLLCCSTRWEKGEDGWDVDGDGDPFVSHSLFDSLKPRKETRWCVWFTSRALHPLQNK